MTAKQIEKAFSDWYDSRTGMPPAAFESWKAGYDEALKQNCSKKSDSGCGGIPAQC